MKPLGTAEADARDPRRRSAAAVARARSDLLLVPSTSQWEGRVDGPVVATVTATNLVAMLSATVRTVAP